MGITVVTMLKLASLLHANIQGIMEFQHWDHRTPLPPRSRQTLPVLPTTTSPSLTGLGEPRLTIMNPSPQSEMSYVVHETRRIRLILVIALGAMILLQFLQLILASTSEGREIIEMDKDVKDVLVRLIENSDDHRR